jgi:hypothetical protein
MPRVYSVLWGGLYCVFIDFCALEYNESDYKRARALRGFGGAAPDQFLVILKAFIPGDWDWTCQCPQCVFAMY